MELDDAQLFRRYKQWSRAKKAYNLYVRDWPSSELDFTSVIHRGGIPSSVGQRSPPWLPFVLCLKCPARAFVNFGAKLRKPRGNTTLRKTHFYCKAKITGYRDILVFVIVIKIVFTLVEYLLSNKLLWCEAMNAGSLVVNSNWSVSLRLCCVPFSPAQHKHFIRSLPSSKSTFSQPF